MHPFINDPFALVYKSAKDLYPDINCEIFWDNTKDENGDNVCGYTSFNNNNISIHISYNINVIDAVEILAHELAHVVLGLDSAHNEEWEEVFDKIHKRYEYLVAQKENGLEEKKDVICQYRSYCYYYLHKSDDIGPCNICVNNAKVNGEKLDQSFYREA